jgi:hypothetical protein
LGIDPYRHFRIAWERAVEEILLRNVVLRFRKSIETQRLDGVLVEDADYATVNIGCPDAPIMPMTRHN